MPLIFRAVPEFPQLESLHKDKASIPQEGGKECPPPNRTQALVGSMATFRGPYGGQTWSPRGNAPDIYAAQTLSVLLTA